MLALCVAGARPNFMKLKPVVDALDNRGAETLLVHTGQHYDRLMSDVFFDELGLRPPDRWLGVGSGTHAEQTGAVMTALETVVGETTPDIVVVVGDVNSTLGAALVGAKAGSLVAHVEAGLRSRDWSMPEEINRVVTDRVSDYLFAPSADAAENLRAEGYRADQIHVVGNVMIDTLLRNLPRARLRSVIDDLGLERKAYGVVTLHRPANVDDPDVLSGIVAALEEVAVECPLVFPVHPRARARVESQRTDVRLRVIEPLGYLDFLALQDGARVVLTDSGGVQEETTALGVACLTLRDNTERPITVSEGTNVVVGRRPDRIVAEARRAIEHGVVARRPAMWDGHAGVRIADVLMSSGDRTTRRRPTDR